MFGANTYRIRLATAADADPLGRLADRNGQQPPAGRVLIGEIDGAPAAALSLDDGRVLAYSSRRTGQLVTHLRMRASALRAYERTPSLRDRLLARLPAWYHAGSLAPTES